MTSVCVGNAASQPIPGLRDNLVVAGALADILGLIPAANWLLPFVPLLELGAYFLPTFCAAEPPTIQQFTVDEVIALSTLRLNDDYRSGIEKAVAYIGNIVWYRSCQCVAGTQPTPPAAPVDPGGVGIVGGTPAYPINQPCLVRTLDRPVANAGSPQSFGFIPFNGLVPTSLQVIESNNSSLTFPNSGTCDYQFFTNGHTSMGAPANFAPVRTGPGTITFTPVLVPAGANEASIRSFVGTSGTAHITQTINFYCGGVAPGGTQSPCCPPDLPTQNAIRQILSLVTLIQRQSVPFAYVPSTAHTGLSGAGALSISGLLGVKIHVSTLPAPIGREGTSPTEYFDMGWITFGTPDGYPQSYRLEREDQLILPARCSAFTELAYDLRPSVVITVTELVREP